MHRPSIVVFATLLASVGTAAENPPANWQAATPITQAVGYLTPAEMPSSAALVPPPPAAGSGAMARDEEVNQAALALHDSPRWKLAAQDAVLTFPDVAYTFACALNAPISEEQTPNLMRLLRRTLVDAGRSTSEAKRKYQRQRPFMVNNKPMCTPQREAALRADGSYPSGHSAIGWALGLVLSEVSPEQANALLARGRAYGQSRVVCNVHWQSDVLEGQLMGSAVVARLHAQSEFRNDVEAARAELQALRAKSASTARDCSIETQALQSSL